MSLLNHLVFAVRTFVLADVPHRSSERVARVQNRRLRRLLRHAVQHSAFYREKYRGIDVERAPLGGLPTTTKQELMANFDQGVTDPRVNRAGVEQWMADSNNLGKYYLGRYGVSHTSGSQGQPLLILQDRKALETLFAILAARGSSFSKPGIWEGARRLFSPARLAIVTTDRGFYPSGAAFEFMTSFVGSFVKILRLSSIQADLIEQLNRFQPMAIVGYASVLETLALQADRLRLPHLRQVSSTSERLTEKARDRIAHALGVPVINHYGIGECLFLSEGCNTHPGAHINIDWAIAEVVDDQGLPVPPGQLGSKVLVTNLANFIQPFIRYEVGDKVILATEACHCGSRFPRIERIEGRSAEFFWIDNGTSQQMVNGSLLHNALDRMVEVREWQAVQRQRNHIEIRLEPLPGANIFLPEAQQQVITHLRASGLPDYVTITVCLEPALQTDPQTGKFRRLVSLVES